MTASFEQPSVIVNPPVGEANPSPNVDEVVKKVANSVAAIVGKASVVYAFTSSI